MDNLNSIPKSGSYGAGVDLHNDNYQKIGVELQTLRELGQNNKGYFETIADLKSKYPTPQSGWQAYIKDAGSSTGYYVANVNSSGNWVVTAAEAPPINVDLAGYAKTGGSTKTVKEVEDEIVQLAGDTAAILNDHPVTKEGYTKSDGVFVPHADWKTSHKININIFAEDYIEVSGVNSYEGETIIIPSVLGFDASGNVVYTSTISGNSVISKNFLNGAATVVLNGYSQSSPTIKGYGLINKLVNLNKKNIDDLSSYIGSQLYGGSLYVVEGYYSIIRKYFKHSDYKSTLPIPINQILLNTPEGIQIIGNCSGYEPNIKAITFLDINMNVTGYTTGGLNKFISVDDIPLESYYVIFNKYLSISDELRIKGYGDINQKIIDINQTLKEVDDSVSQIAGKVLPLQNINNSVFVGKNWDVGNVTGNVVLGGISSVSRLIVSSTLVNRTGFIPCKAGDKFLYSGIVLDNVPVGGWINADVDEACTILVNPSEGAQIASGVYEFKNYEVTIPSGVNYIVACSRTETHPETPARLTVIKGDVIDFVRLITEDDNPLSEDSTLPVIVSSDNSVFVGKNWDVGNVTGNVVLGSISENTNKIIFSTLVNRTSFIPCQEGDTFRYSGIVYTNIPVGGWVAQDIDEACTPLLDKTDGEMIAPGVYEFSNHVIQIPAGINYIVACSRTETHPETPARLTVIKGDVIDFVRLITEDDTLPSIGISIQTSPDISPIYSQERKTMNLCAIKKTIEDNNIPVTTGFLFHEYPANNGKLYYSKTLDNPEYLGEVGSGSFNVSLCMIALSPSGKVILVRRHQPSNLYVFDTETLETVTVNFTENESFPRNPMGWLYNSGIDFGADGDGKEYCIFNEYSHGGRTPLYVWRGEYPYTSVDDWEIVLQEDADVSGGIHHWHQVRRDPWTGIIYAIAGDYPGECKWYYSSDHGKTWSLLTAGELWEENAARTINLLFTENQVYWATDHSTNHSLNSIQRGNNGILDLSTRIKLQDLSPTQATNFIALVENPYGIFIYDRKNTNSIGKTEGVWVYFYDLNKNRLVNLHFYKHFQGVDTWWGHRGKCYVEYTNSMENRLAMGVSEDTPILFDLVGNTGESIGTVMYLLSGTI